MKYLMLIVCLLVLSTARAEADTQPTTAPAAEMGSREGTKIEISDAEVAEIKQWIQNAKYALTALRDNWRLATTSEKLRLAKAEFARIVGESGAKNNELYVRYVLNRALAITDIFSQNPTDAERESLLGIYDESITLALKLYVDDNAYLEAIGAGKEPAKTLKHPAVFGIEYAEMLLAYSQTFLDPKIEFQVTRSAIGFLGNDINSARNLDRARFTEQIVRVQQLLRVYPTAPKGDAKLVLQDIRKIKFEYRERLRPAITSTLPGIGITFEMPVTALATAPSIESSNQSQSPVKKLGRFDDLSFQACLKRIGDDIDAASAVEKCMDYTKKISFVDNPSLNLCLSHVMASQNAAYSVEHCVDNIVGSKRNYNANYEACYRVIKSGAQGLGGSDKCIDVASWFTFLNNPSFDRCAQDLSASMGSYGVVEECVKSIGVDKKNYNSNYITCYEAIKPDSPGYSGSNKCIELSSWFTFNDNGDFSKCVALMRRGTTSYNAVNKCVALLSK